MMQYPLTILAGLPWHAGMDPLASHLLPYKPFIASSAAAQGTCPEEPVADLAVTVQPDGQCHRATYKQHGGNVTFQYKIACHANGSSTWSYLDLASPSGNFSCDKPKFPVFTLPAEYCIAGLPGLQGARLQCSTALHAVLDPIAKATNTTFFGWSGKSNPPIKQITDHIPMPDGAKLVTSTVFPEFLSDTNATIKVATLYVQTPYDQAPGH